MRSDNSRLLATLVVWGSFTSLFMVLFFLLAWVGRNVDSPSTFVMLVMFLAMLAGVVRATQAIWSNAPAEDATKAKRIQNSRVRRLVESLSDDEVYELEAMLLNQQQTETNHYGRS